MKIKISKILLVLSVCGLLYSCDKFFEVDLKAQMDEEKVVNNEDYLARLWAGLYWATGSFSADSWAMCPRAPSWRQS